MNRDNITAILGILKTAYPNFYKNMTSLEISETISLWQEMFSDMDIRILTIAVKSLITHFEFPPTIATVKKEILKITSKSRSEIDYWQYAFKMMSNANYMTQQEFDTYPNVCKKFFGSTSNLRAYGRMEVEYVLNNIQPRFIKFAENYKKEQEENKLLPNEYKKMILSLASNYDIGG